MRIWDSETGRPTPAGRLLVKLDNVRDLTCLDCPCVGECEWAWDAYNTNGDCLASK